MAAIQGGKGNDMEPKMTKMISKGHLSAESGAGGLQDVGRLALYLRAKGKLKSTTESIFN